ncbi:MAG: iron-containing redox enzyme family protein [Solirubrobacteraceae bacterium]|nr:iron-containing redox enzyme family protein [Solirubrobacteraceae bacterium]
MLDTKTDGVLLDVAIRQALDDPDLRARTEAEPTYAAGLIADARATATAAFAEGDGPALDAAHRTLYAIYAQHAWSPVGAMRDNQHDPTIAAVLAELVRGFEGWLAGFALPEAPPEEPEAFTAWLTDLALHRPMPELPSTGMGDFIRDEITLDQLKEIVAQRSLFFLKEPDPWAMVIPSLHGEAKAGLLDLLLDEYGWGRYDQMHSTIYEDLMGALELETGYDAYAPRTSWQFLAGMNLQNMYARHRRLCRRMYGYIYLVEADSPRAMKNYLGAWDRLGLGDDERITRFYELHVTADEGHQEVALDEIILPVVKAEPQARTDIARGVWEGRVTDELFANHRKDAFGAGRSSLCR